MWVNGGRDKQVFEQLINAACRLYVAVMRQGSSEQREAVAQELSHLRAAGPFPVAGADEFLNLLQRLLRGEDGTSGEAGRIRAMLPDPFPEVLQHMERYIRGKQVVTPPARPPAPSASSEAAAMRATVEQLLSQLTPQEQAELAVMAQVVPVLHQGLGVLTNEQAGMADRVRAAEQLEAIAERAEAGEAAGSPWLDGGAALRVVAGWLRGTPPDLADLPPMYRAVLGGG